MSTIPFTPSLWDHDGFPVVWDTDCRCPVQDPSLGGTNYYSSSDVFTDSVGGSNLYRVSQPDGTVYPLNSVTPPSQQANQAPGSQQGTGRNSSPSSNNPTVIYIPIISSGAPTTSTAPGSATLSRTASGTPAAATGAATGATIAGQLNSVGKLLGSPFGTGTFQLPLWAWLGSGAVAFVILQGRRR